MAFTPSQIYSLANLINTTDFDEGALPFPDETERMLVRMPQKEMSLAFDEEEWNTLREVLNEALYLHEAYALLE